MNWTAESCTQEAQKYVLQWEDLQYSNSNGQGRRSWQSVMIFDFHEVHVKVQ